MAKDCTYRFTDRDGKEQVIQGQAAFKAYLASGGLEHLLPSAPVAFSGKQENLNERFRQQIFSDFDAAVREYKALPDTKNGKLLDTDQVRELSPEYRADRSLAPQVHEAASAFTQRAFEERMANAPDGALVIFMAGGGGAGKSSAEHLLSDAMERANTILDGTLSSYDKASRNVQLALDNNQTVRIAYVYREPLDALASEKGGVLERAMKRGRPVTLEALVKGHVGSSETVRKLQQAFGDNPNFKIQVIDNSRGAGNAVMSTLEDVPAVQLEGLMEKFKNATDQALAEGRISETIHRATTTPYDTRETDGGQGQRASVRPGDGRETERRDEPGQAEYPVNRAAQKNPEASRVEGTSAERFKRTEQLQQAVGDLQEGKITRNEYDRMVDELRPVYPYEKVPAVTTVADARYALANGRGQSAEKAAKYGVPTMTLVKGDWAQLRLDIPSYQEHDTWVVSVHTPKSTNREVQAAYDAGPVVGYESVAALTDVTFGMNQKAAVKIATGSAKGTIATMLGKWSPISKADAKARADAALNDPAWTQVGMDPFRHSYFYDRDTMRPVLAADEVIQVGPLVLAKNVKFGQDTDITGAPIMFSAKQDLPVDTKLERWAKTIFDKLGSVAESKILAERLPHPSLSMGPGVPLGDRQMVVLDGHALDHAAKHVEDGITARMIGQLPAALKDPRMVAFQGPGQALVMLPLRAANGAPIVVALKKEEVKGGGTTLKVTRFATTYPLENSASYIVREMRKGNRIWLPEEEVSRLRDLLGKLNATQPRGTGPGVTQTLALPLARGGNQAVKDFSVLSDAALAKKQTNEKGWERETETVSVPNDAEKQLQGIAFAKRQRVGKETEGWLLSRDELGRFRFGAGAKAYRYAADVANAVLDVVGMKPVSPELSRAMRKMRMEVDKAQNLTVEVAKTMKDLPEQERQMISDVIEGELKRGATPPKRVLEIAASMQDIMSEQSAELVRLGMLSKDAAGRWDGKYLPRFYEQKLGDETKAWMKAVKGLLGRKQTMQGIKGSSLKARGMFETVPVADLADWEAEGWAVRDATYDPAVDTEITVWRDYTRTERDDMGEIRDAMFRFVMGYNKSQRDIALGRLYENLAATYASKTEQPGYVQVPATNVEDTFAKRYGKLSGKYVPSEILDQLVAFDSDMQNDLTKIYLKGLSMWKEGKTVLNPVAHANNVLSNITMAHFAGVSYWDAHKYIGSIKDLVKGDAMVEEAREAGLFGGTFNRAELTEAMPEELRVLAQMAESKSKRAVEMVWNGLSLWLRKPLGKAYNAEDEFFRYVIYRDARNNGLSVDDSVDYALKYMFSYDDMPKGARVIRDMPVGLPFFSYTYKIVPALVNTALEHPVRYAAPAVAIYVANAAMYAIAASLGGGEDEDWWTIIRRYMTDPEFRQRTKDLEEQERKNLPTWMKGASLSLGTEKSIRLGMDDLTNLPVFLDVSRIFPGGDLFDAHNNAGGIPLLAPITPNSPVLTVASAMLFNKDTFRGQDIVKKTDTDAEAAQKRAAWMWKQMTPAIAVGNTHFERAMNVIANVTGQSVNVGLAEYTGIGKDGLPITPGYAALQTVGIKARPIDLDTSEKIQKAQTKALIRELEAQIKQSQRLENKGAISPTTGEAEREKLREKKQFIRQGLTVEGEEKD